MRTKDSRCRSDRRHREACRRPIVFALLLAAALLAVSDPASAELRKTYVPEFSVTGAPEGASLKTALPGLLASRLDRARMKLVDDPAQADLVVAGSYTVIGKVFSLDVLVKSADGAMFFKLFEQGEGQDDLIPAVGRLARKIDAAMAEYASAEAPPSMSSPAPPAGGVATAVAPPAGGIAVPRKAGGKDAAAFRSTPPIEGVFVGLAPGRTSADGARELFLAGEHVIRYCRWKGAGVETLAEVSLPAPAKILGIDTADLDDDGVPEIYVTVMDRESLVSQVYLPEGAALRKIADRMPYFFRGLDLDGKSRKILVQEMGIDEDFFGGAAELVKSGSRFETRNRRQLPRFGRLYNFNRFVDAAGNGFCVVLGDDGHLIVYASDGRELWKSGDTFGGSEISFRRETPNQGRFTTDAYRRVFLEQRIVVTPDGGLIVPKNEGTFNVGDYRSYNKHTVHGLRWNGSALEERWRIGTAPGSLADYAYDASTRELVLMEIVQKEDLQNRGRTVISVHRSDPGFN